MKHPNAFYIGDTLLADNHLVTVLAFVKPGYRQLVKVRFPDGSERTRGFDTLRRLVCTCGEPATTQVNYDLRDVPMCGECAAWWPDHRIVPISG